MEIMGMIRRRSIADPPMIRSDDPIHFHESRQMPAEMEARYSMNDLPSDVPGRFERHADEAGVGFRPDPAPADGRSRRPRSFGGLKIGA